MRSDNELAFNSLTLGSVLKIFVYSPNLIKLKILKLLKLALSLTKLTSYDRFLEFLNDLHNLNFSEILIS